MAIPAAGAHGKRLWREVATIAGEEGMQALKGGTKRHFLLGDRKRLLTAEQLFYIAAIAARGSAMEEPMNIRVSNENHEARITTWFGDGWKRRWRTTLTFE